MPAVTCHAKAAFTVSPNTCPNRRLSGASSSKSPCRFAYYGHTLPDWRGSRRLVYRLPPDPSPAFDTAARSLSTSDSFNAANSLKHLARRLSASARLRPSWVMAALPSRKPGHRCHHRQFLHVATAVEGATDAARRMGISLENAQVAIVGRIGRDWENLRSTAGPPRRRHCFDWTRPESP